MRTRSEDVINNFLDFDMCNQYFCSINDILLIQRDDIGNPLTNTDLTTYRIKKSVAILSLSLIVMDY